MEAVKTAAHILNRVPRKSVLKSPYELWTGRKLTLNYLHVWNYPAGAKVFNPNIGKLDSKIVSCHFIGYPAKLKGYRFYCPDRYTKFVEIRHAVFLEDEMVRGSMIVREISLEEKRVHAPTPMIQEPFFSIPVVAAPTVRDTAVTTPVVSSLVATMNKNEEPVVQDPMEPVVAQEKELQQPQVEEVPISEGPRRSQTIRKPAISKDYEVYVSE
jgi:hypothetical protein